MPSQLHPFTSPFSTPRAHCAPVDLAPSSCMLTAPLSSLHAAHPFADARRPAGAQGCASLLPGATHMPMHTCYCTLPIPANLVVVFHLMMAVGTPVMLGLVRRGVCSAAGGPARWPTGTPASAGPGIREAVHSQDESQVQGWGTTQAATSNASEPIPGCGSDAERMRIRRGGGALPTLPWLQEARVRQNVGPAYCICYPTANEWSPWPGKRLRVVSGNRSGGRNLQG